MCRCEVGFVTLAQLTIISLLQRIISLLSAMYIYLLSADTPLVVYSHDLQGGYWDALSQDFTCGSHVGQSGGICTFITYVRKDTGFFYRHVCGRKFSDDR